jgi:hypothetical protein
MRRAKLRAAIQKELTIRRCWISSTVARIDTFLAGAATHNGIASVEA